MSDGRWLEGAHDPALAELRRAMDEAKLRGPDDVTLRRLWGRLAEPAGGRRRAPRWLWFAGGMVSTAAFAFAFAIWLWPRATATSSRVTVATATRASESSGPDAAPEVVTPGTVRTGPGETLRLTLRGGTEARLGSSSVLSLDSHDRPAVEGGDVGFSVPHQAPGHTFVVHAGPYRVVVVGTKFHLRVEGAEARQRVFVSVDEGVVEVWDHARLARLNRGDSWASPGDLETPAAVPAPETTTTAAPTTAAADTHVHAASHLIAHGHHPSKAHVVAMAAAPASVATPVVALPVAAAPAIVPPPAGANEAPPAPVADPATQARAALAAGDTARALALYRMLAQRGGPAGENAEYEIGKVLRDRLSQPANALAAWRRYRSEHPDGLLRVETDVSIIETLVHGGDADAALSEAEDFLRRHPDSERRAEMARVAGDLYRARGDCRHAVGAYQSALASPHAAGVAEAATFHRASCLGQLGDSGAADAAQEYLRRWPAGRFHSEAARLIEAEGASRP